MCPCRFQVDPMELALCSESDLSATSRMNAYVKFLGFVKFPNSHRTVWTGKSTC